jgi:Tol biopolymer transport system component
MFKHKFLLTRANFFLGLLVFSLAAPSCSINISQTPPIAPSLEVATALPTATPEEVHPTPLNATPTDSLPTTTIPVTWASLHLTGKLIYLKGDIEDNTFTVDIQSLDLATGVITTIFNGPKNSWTYYVTVFPDNKQVIMSYLAPPTEATPPRAALYLLPLDGSQPPQLLFEPPTPDDNYIQAEWSPDGNYLYFTQVNFHLLYKPGQMNPIYSIFRIKYPNGQPELIAEKAYWPRLSSDSSRLVYVYVDPFSPMNKLYVADSDGANAHQIVVSGSWNPNIKDAPIFSPDQNSIILSAIVPLPSYRPNWVEKLMNVRLAKADGNLPSDWWSVPITGGPLKRLTQIKSLGLFASLSPDHQHFASFSSDGIFVMNPDGSNLTQLIPNMAGISGTVSWLP